MSPCLFQHLILAQLSISGSSVCPSPAQVLTQLSQLIAVRNPNGPAPEEFAFLDQSGSELRIRLSDRNGVALGERLLPRAGSCEALAETVAVILASWESDLPSRSPERIPRLVAFSNAPPEAKDARPVAPWTLRGSVTAGELISDSLAEEGPIPFATVAVSVGRARSPWRIVGALSFQGQRSLDFEGGVVRWRRWMLGLGVERGFPARWLPSWLTLDARADLLPSLLVLQGINYAPNFQGWSGDLGVGIELEMWFGPWSWKPGLCIGAQAWPIPQRLKLSDSPGSGILPQFEALASLALSFPVR